MSNTTTVGDRSRRGRQRPAVETLEGRALLTLAGSLDTSFGGGTGYYLGSVNPGNFTGLDDLNLVQVESDNSILAAGPVGTAGSLSFGVIHLSADGTLDTSFGTDGEADVALPSGVSVNLSPTTLLVQPDGKIVVAGVAATGDNANDVVLIARFDADGQPDPTFGTGGVEAFDPTTVGANPGFVVRDVALQADGKFVVVGSAPVSTSPLAARQITAFRLDADGTADTSFGIGGLVTTGDVANDGDSTDELPDGVVVQPDGQIVIVGNLQTTTGFFSGSIPELIRLNADGSRDDTISEAGLSASGITFPQDLIQEPSGQLLVLGETSLRFGSPILAQLDGDGALDQSVPLSSVLGYSGTTGMALQPDGDIALFNTEGDTSFGSVTVTLFRLTPDLTPDLTFGYDGETAVSIDTTAGIPILAEAMAVGPNNQIVLVGSDIPFEGSSEDGATTVAVLRLTATSTPPPTVPVSQAVPNDFNGDGVSDPTVYLPASGSFAIRPSGGGPDIIVPFGVSGPGQTIPATGDYTGSGVTEIGAYLTAYGVYAYRPSGGGPDVLVPFGMPGAGLSIPATGDYFGTGQDDIAVYMPTIGSFGIRNPAGGPDEIIPFGTAGIGQSIPAPGDYFGTGVTDLAVYLTSIGAFAIRNPTGGPDEIIPFGIPGAGNSIPIPGDYDGSGKTELAVYLPRLGEFAYRPADGGPDVIVPFGAVNDGSLPVPGDYDGSGKTEVAIYDPNYASFAYRPADGGSDVIFSFGTPGYAATLPAATPPGALPGFSGIAPTEIPNQSVVTATSVDIPSASSKRVKMLVNQGSSDSTDALS